MAALRESLARIELPWSKYSFIEHQSITSADKTESKSKIFMMIPKENWHFISKV